MQSFLAFSYAYFLELTFPSNSFTCTALEVLCLLLFQCFCSLAILTVASANGCSTHRIQRNECRLKDFPLSE